MPLACIPARLQNHASCFTISLPLYVPQALQTLCERLYSPHFGHFVMPGRSSFHTFERLLSRLAFDTFLFGTAMLPTPPLAPSDKPERPSLYKLRYFNNVFRTASLGSVSCFSHVHGPSLRFLPHFGQSPRQSSRQSVFDGISSISCSSTGGRRSSLLSSIKM